MTELLPATNNIPIGMNNQICVARLSVRQHLRLKQVCCLLVKENATKIVIIRLLSSRLPVLPSMFLPFALPSHYMPL